MANKLVKIISLNEQVFPQTVAEAVLVKDNGIITLNAALDKKIESIVVTPDSGLTSTKQGTSVILTHSNKITPNDKTEPLLIKYDQNGHIIDTDTFKNYTVLVNNQVYTQYNGEKDTSVQLGDDFTIDESNNIALAWGGLKY